MNPDSFMLWYNFIRYFISYAVLFKFTKFPARQAVLDHSQPNFSFLISSIQTHGSALFSKYHKLLVSMLTCETVNSRYQNIQCESSRQNNSLGLLLEYYQDYVMQCSIQGTCTYPSESWPLMQTA